MASLEAPPEPNPERSRLYTDVVKCYLNDYGNPKHLKLVVIGEAGQGKSTLINGLLGKEVANEGEDFGAGTLEIKYYHLNQNGVSVRIWDTPGFGVGSVEEDEKMVETLRRSECYPHDLALFCFRMDGTRFPTRVHIDTIQKFTEVFRKEFWKHTVFILTFANNVAQLCPPNEELEDFFSHRIWELEEKIKETLKKHVNLSIDELKTVRAIPVGSYKQGIDPKNPWALPDRDDWFVWFWMECTDHMHQAAVSALLQANIHRINIVSEIAPEYGQPMPPSHVYKPFERAIESSPDEITKVINDSPSVTDELGKGEILITASTTMDQQEVNSTCANENLTAREIPFFLILQRQLDNKDSGFSMYVKEYAKKRGKSVWVLGHIGGFIEGLAEYIGKGSRFKGKKKKQ